MSASQELNFPGMVVREETVPFKQLICQWCRGQSQRAEIRTHWSMTYSNASLKPEARKPCI